ncbi:Similar to predicted protein [Chaetomium globosum CBS 148.51]; acc. no. XP_001223087 [Pyronema omphalodes CBS 100304]|uniref:Uncharacterized protein n=1 Tax=Pyronema omphalodes (strain CBS 100304) TaxID=1076935 RepID=U4LUX0_PYROM|nr:Similar to predicted protein [Chaetomium globosum CBS 148.51]; acc. no. XP_001223087 [Pyronema omphalodes CBS 100304]
MSFRHLPKIIALLAIVYQSPVASLVIRQAATGGTTGLRSSIEDLKLCATDLGFPVLKFLIANYVAHAFTIRFKPGSGPFYTLVFSLWALFFPYFGLILACRSLEHFAVFEDNPLETALKAGGLCTVARTHRWKPEKGDKLFCLRTSETGTTKTAQPLTPSADKDIEAIRECGSNTTTTSKNGATIDYVECTDPSNRTPKSKLEPITMDKINHHIYCEEALENIQQRYIRIHGLCYLPRGKCAAQPTSAFPSSSPGHPSTTEGKKKKRCDTCNRKISKPKPKSQKSNEDSEPIKSQDVEEGTPNHNPKNLGCQVGQYMMVRIPAACEVTWKNMDVFRSKPNQRKYHARISTMEKIKNMLYFWKTNEDYLADNGGWISNNDTSISASYSIIKSFIALFQLYSIIGFLREEKRGGRINDYAAYQLTLIPYGLMSVINIICGLMTPSYPAVYMVKNSVMEEAIERGGVFDGIVGELVEKPPEKMELRQLGDSNPIPDERRAFIRNEKLSTIQSRMQMFGVLLWNYAYQFKTVIPFVRFVPFSAMARMFRATMMEIWNILRCRGTDTPDVPLDNGSKTAEVTERADPANKHATRLGVMFRTYWNAIKDIFKSIKNLFAGKQEIDNSRLPEERFYNAFKDQDEPQDKTSTSSNNADTKTLPYEHFIFPIGNAPRHFRYRWTCILSDYLIILSIAAPFVITWALTGFATPIKRKWHGIVFLVWLILGEVTSFSFTATWELIHSYVSQLGRKHYVWAVSALFFATACAMPAAVLGFVLLGIQRYDYLKQNPMLGNSNMSCYHLASNVTSYFQPGVSNPRF